MAAFEEISFDLRFILSHSMQTIFRYIEKNIQRIMYKIFYPTILRAIKDAIRRSHNATEQWRMQSVASSEGPLDLFILQNFIYKNRGHFDTQSYAERRMRRISKILEIFGVEWFKGKNILDIGGGVGDIGAFFACLGARVVSAEYRASNRNFASIRYRNIPNFKTVFFDGEKDFTHLRKYAGDTPDSKFDLVLCLGFLEVIADVNNVIRCSRELSNIIILETQVCDSVDPEILLYADMPQGLDDYPIGNKGARPSPFYIENEFMKCGWMYERHFSADLNTSGFLYDWSHKNTGAFGKERKAFARFWCFKNTGK